LVNYFAISLDSKTNGSAVVCGFTVVEPNEFFTFTRLVAYRDSLENNYTCDDCLGLQYVYPILDVCVIRATFALRLLILGDCRCNDLDPFLKGKIVMVFADGCAVDGQYQKLAGFPFCAREKSDFVLCFKKSRFRRESCAPNRI
jgi:hypothetical protein